MGDDNDFTFCQVGSPVDQENLKVDNALPDIGRVKIEDKFLNNHPGNNNQVESSSRKQQLLDNAKLKSRGTFGSLSFTVVDMSSPKNLTELPKQSVLPHSKDSVNDSEEKKISTKKPIVPTKVPFEKGYSQMDWLKLTRTHPDLAGLKGESCKRLISMDEVKKHRTEGSIWTVLKGRVYNISPYMNFHPGGVDMLMKAAGKDCTSLFNKYHAWVNAQILLEKCLVGTLDESR